jgi:hypothetical protein
MRALKTSLRWSFAFTAMFLFPAAIFLFVYRAHAASVASPFARYGIVGALLAAGLLFAMACWTTRRSAGAIRSPWAVTASIVNIATGLLILRFGHHIRWTSPEPLMIAEGLLGLFVFSRRGQAYTPEPVAAKPASVPGDRTSPWFDRAATLLFIFATFKVLGLWMPWGRAHHLPAASVLLWFSYICFVILITAVLHEGGHALAAYTFRMKLLSFNAGPLQWRKREGKWRFQFRTSGVLGGNVHVLPTHPDQPAWHDICMVAAGPLVNLSTGPIFLWAAFHAQGAPWQPAWFFFALMASFSFLAAAFNLLPFRSATGSYSDGARILQLLTKSPVVEVQRALRRLQAATAETAGA